jgi:hypothetical protein
MSVVTSFPICCSHPIVPHTSSLYWNAGLAELTHVKLAACQCRILCLRTHPSGELPNCASEELLSNTYSLGNACKVLLVSPSHNSCSVRYQSRMEPTQPTIPLVSPDGGALFLEFVRLIEQEAVRIRRTVPHQSKEGKGTAQPVAHTQPTTASPGYGEGSQRRERAGKNELREPRAVARSCPGPWCS